MSAGRREQCGSLEHLFATLGGVPTTTRMDRKLAHITTARACGERFALQQGSQVDPQSFLAGLPLGRLTRQERAARDALLPATWQGAFSKGWRGAQG